MESFLRSDIFSPKRLKNKLNALLEWVGDTFLTEHQPIKTIAGNTLVGVGDVSLADLGLNRAVIIRGESLTALTDGATTSPISLDGGITLTPVTGDAVYYQTSEFVWVGNHWKDVGPDLSEIRDIAEAAIVL